MNIRIRHVARRRKGLVVQNELIVSKQVLSVGRATDQDIFLSDLGVAYHHARITFAPDGQIGISSLTSAGFYFNGRFAQSGSLKDAGEFQLGPYLIKIEAGRDGYDYDVSIEQVAQDVVEVQGENLPAMRLDQTWLSKRGLAWLGFLLVLAIGLVFPVASYLDKGFAKQARNSELIPDDGLWISGDISSPHRHFGKQCTSCHKKAFKTVADRTCIECHGETTAHADPEIYDIHKLQGLSCQSCHKEHSGNDYLIRHDQKLCSDCHASLSATVNTDLEDVSDFESNHPEFKPRLLIPVKQSREGSVKNEWRRVSLDSSKVEHETGLIFPHDVHLDPNGLDSPSGNKVLQCSDCHQTDAGEAYLLPIEFERHCQECHRLTFDENSPERELPHSDLDAMSATLEEYYAFMALRGNYQDDDEFTPAVVTRRRIPGKELTPVERRTALAWAQEKAADVKEEMIEFRACGYCHKVERDASANSGWRVPEVHISQRWFTRGAFDHKTHRATRCEDCHDAEQSRRSEDVLLPRIKECRECHGGEHSEGKLQSTCITCHAFHTPGNVLLGQRNNKDD